MLKSSIHSTSINGTVQSLMIKNAMNITFISDTHGKHEEIQIPKDTEMLIHAGDISNVGTLQEVRTFLEWYDKIEVKYKIFIGGNHDFFLEQNAPLFEVLLMDYPTLIYLENEEKEIGGIKLWGSPITPWFHNWAFNRHRGTDIARYWEQIPEEVDILITHGPPMGYGDKLFNGDLVGCEGLLQAVQKIKPAIHVFGHIHEAYGIFKNESTTFINASCLNLRYQAVNEPIMVDFYNYKRV